MKKIQSTENDKNFGGFGRCFAGLGGLTLHNKTDAQDYCTPAGGNSCAGQRGRYSVQNSVRAWRAGQRHKCDCHAVKKGLRGTKFAGELGRFGNKKEKMKMRRWTKLHYPAAHGSGWNYPAIRMVNGRRK